MIGKIFLIFGIIFLLSGCTGKGNISVEFMSPKLDITNSDNNFQANPPDAGDNEADNPNNL